MDGGGEGNGGGESLESSRGRSGMRTAVAAVVRNGSFIVSEVSAQNGEGDDAQKGFLNAFLSPFFFFLHQCVQACTRYTTVKSLSTSLAEHQHHKQLALSVVTSMFVDVRCRNPNDDV